MQSIGFKEWAVVCEALGRGKQSIILRKGGIAEGRAGFSFQHHEFYLFPTWFHEQPEKVNAPGIAMPEAKTTGIEIQYFAQLESAQVITAWPVAEALAPFHILKPEVVRERFDYDQAPGIHVAFVRVFRLVPPWRLTNEKKFGGCRSWVPLPEPPADLQLEPVLSETEHAEVQEKFRDLIR
jgi:hypothetical protein